MDKDKTTDNIFECGFISKGKLLEYVSEEDIFELVFGFKPVEFEYVESPFRDDKNPGCWFERELVSGKLRFKDFADSRVIQGIRMANIDCFDAVTIFYKLPNFYKTLDFIKTKLIDGKDVKNNIPHVLPKKALARRREKVGILIGTRDFLIQDKNFWFLRYGITKENLIEDKVFPLEKFKLTNTKTGDYVFRTPYIAYAYTEFESGNKKIYSPLQKDKLKKFITNCVADDVGGMQSKIKAGRCLVITKSYKDFRVLRNLGVNVRWLQNEGMFPTSTVFWQLLENFNDVVVFFDNDKVGIEASIKFSELINMRLPGKSRRIHLPEELFSEVIKDPSDLVHKIGQQELINFLKHNRVIL